MDLKTVYSIARAYRSYSDFKAHIDNEIDGIPETVVCNNTYKLVKESDSLPCVSDRRGLLIKYQNWYWKEVQGKPYQTSASDIVDSFDE